MRRFCLSLLLAASFALPAFPAVQPFPPSFRVLDIKAGGHRHPYPRRRYGAGVVLLHGFADTGDMWAPLARALYKHHTVIVPDLRGMGLSSQPRAAMTRKPKASISPW